MAKTKKQVEQAQGAQPTIEKNFDYWFNEYEYFMDAIEGLKMSHAILYQMGQHAKQKAQELNPDFNPKED